MRLSFPWEPPLRSPPEGGPLKAVAGQAISFEEASFLRLSLKNALLSPSRAPCARARRRGLRRRPWPWSSLIRRCGGKKIFPFFRLFPAAFFLPPLDILCAVMYNEREALPSFFPCEVTETMGAENNTITFSVDKEREDLIKRTLTDVYDSLKEKGYNPINQIVGYLLSEDPTYITNYNNARTLIRKLDRDELLQELVRQYLRDS